jgi:hypothetical protein
MRKIIADVLSVACVFLLSSCATWQSVTVYPSLNVTSEVIVKPELQKFISERKQNFKIALRVPSVPKSMTQETQKDIDRKYDYFERELAKEGFVIRDRELLEKILADGKPVNYQELAQSIDTDIIIEILYMGACTMSHKRYFELRSGHLIDLNNMPADPKKPETMPFDMQGGQLDCRIITVKDASVSGMFTIYNLPCEGSCPFEILPGKEWRNPEPNFENARGWNVGNEEQNVRKLAALLAQTLKDGDVVISNVRKDSIAEKNGLLPEDVIVKINDQPVYNFTQTIDLLIKSEGTFDLMINREGKTLHMPVVKQYAQPLGIQVAYRAKPSLPPPPPPVVAPTPAPAPVPVEIKKEDTKPATPPAPAAPKAKKAAKK